MSALRTASEGLAWLSARGAHPWLVRHHELVVEAARELVGGLAALGVRFDGEHVSIGAAIHDAGKIVHPREMAEPGHDHEASGEAMLLAAGVDAGLARACVRVGRPALVVVQEAGIGDYLAAFSTGVDGSIGVRYRRSL